jgi:predicted DNA-binding protein YlxM (UPF0122 family)
MDKNIEISMLYDIYGELLTERQKSIFEEYYLFNLSLREIAENKKISYQAVRDSVKSSEKMLELFEDKIGMKKTKDNIEKVNKIINEDKDLNLSKNEILLLLNKNSEDEYNV